METCDVLIVGGGPAGSSCAWRLRRHDLDVVVMDKAEFPRDKVCAGWITPAVLRTLEIDPHEYAKTRILQPITGFRSGLMNARMVTTDYAATVSYGIRRCEFDDYLLRRTGARLRLGLAVKSLRKTDGLWVINEAIAAPLLIGAGGHFCPVARHLGAELGAAESAVAAKEVEFEMTPEQAAECQVRPEMPELYFRADLKGYGWCFRKGRYLNIGLGMEQAHGLANTLESFCDFLRRHGRIPRNIPGHFHGHAYLLRGRSRRRLLDDGVLLAGDAAGLAYRQSGEGIRPAVESGLIAAATVLAAGADYRRQRLASYSERLEARFGAQTGRGFGDVPPALRGFLAGLVLRSRWLTRHVLLDRWFLHATETNLQP